jgi:hypothetical protein
MIRVLCAGVSRGLRAADVIATLRDIHGRNHFLQIEQNFLTQDNGHAYLPVSLVHRDARAEAVLIELPHEAETGVNRIWVSEADVQGMPEVSA